MYKKEDMIFLNMNTCTTINKEKIFETENKLTREEKIKFIDELENGIASYLINILNKWENEKESLSKDNFGSVKTVSKKAWIKRNDKRNILDKDYKIGNYYLFGTKYKTMSLMCPSSEYGNDYTYTNKDIVNQWYHDLCMKLYREEKTYFESINPVSIKIQQVHDYANRYNIFFNSKIVNDIVWNGKEDVSEQELDIYLEAYKKIEEYINEITKDVKDQIDKI